MLLRIVASARTEGADAERALRRAVLAYAEAVRAAEAVHPPADESAGDDPPRV
jgi:XTP/dITP diphosphohydrolase